MGNESSSLQKAIKSFKVLEKEKGGWEDIVRTFVDAVPLYEVVRSLMVTPCLLYL